MRGLLIVGLLFSAISSRATLCSKAAADAPCTPDPGDATKRAKAHILELIRTANSLQQDVDAAKAGYLKVRTDPNATTQQRLDACAAYRSKKQSQDDLYKEALEKTGTLYHVGPTRKQLTIAKPDDHAIEYTATLSARWDPRVTDSGKGVTLVIRIDGADGQPHYTGAVMDPNDANGTRAMTFPNGLTYILRYSFDEALAHGNPGFLAHLLYHEGLHFEQLDRPAKDGSGTRRGWASTEEDEKDAYEKDVKMARVFGLTKAQTDGLRGSLATYTDLVAHGALTSTRSDARKQAALADYYEHTQIDLDGEYAALRNKVEQESQEQQRRQKRAIEEHLEQERLEAQRRQSRLDDMNSAAAQCGYKIRYDTDGETFLGFGDRVDRFPLSRYRVPIDLGDLKVVFLMLRTCRSIELNPRWPAASACNGAASLMRERVGRGDFDAKLKYLAAGDTGSYHSRSECLQAMIENAGGITDTASFDRFVASYQKEAIKRQDKAERAERKRSRQAEPDDRRPRGGDGNTAPERRKRYWDPSCGCWITDLN